MVEEKHESTKNLLDEIEGDWDSPKPGSVRERELHASLDLAAQRLVESLDPPPVSVPTMAELDSGWGDEDEEDDEEEEEIEEPEPERPDEKLESIDPVAYAEAQKAYALAKAQREERMEGRRQRKRVKAEAKKARRRARADAQKQKQKGKSKKARAPQPQQPSQAAQKKAARVASRTASKTSDTWAGDGPPPEQAVDAKPRKLPPSKVIGPAPMLSTTNRKMLAIAVAVFLAAAIFAAVITR